ncbi:MAG: glycosyltransferase [Pseudonocardiaceae bacterium]
MRVLLSTYGSRGDVEPLVGLAVRLRALGAEVRVCAPPDFAQRLAGVGVALVATGMMPAVAGARSVVEKLDIRCVSVTFQQLTLPSPHHPPLAYPGRPFPPEVTDNRVLWDLDAGTPPVYVGFGSMPMRASTDVARVAAVVHHGGAGTTTTATRAGAPQMVVPQSDHGVCGAACGSVRLGWRRPFGPFGPALGCRCWVGLPGRWPGG